MPRRNNHFGFNNLPDPDARKQYPIQRIPIKIGIRDTQRPLFTLHRIYMPDQDRAKKVQNQRNPKTAPSLRNGTSALQERHR